MRKTLFTIATVGLLGLSTVSGAFAQTELAVDQAAAAANTACGAGAGNTPAGCLAAVQQLKVVLARSAVAGVVLTTPVVVNGVTISGALGVGNTAGIYRNIVAAVRRTVQGTSPTIASALDAQAVVTEEQFAASAS